MDFIHVLELDGVKILFLKQRFLSTVKARKGRGGSLRKVVKTDFSNQK